MFVFDYVVVVVEEWFVVVFVVFVCVVEFFSVLVDVDWWFFVVFDCWVFGY